MMRSNGIAFCAASAVIKLLQQIKGKLAISEIISSEPDVACGNSHSVWSCTSSVWNISFKIFHTLLDDFILYLQIDCRRWNEFSVMYSDRFLHPSRNIKRIFVVLVSRVLLRLAFFSKSKVRFFLQLEKDKKLIWHHHVHRCRQQVFLKVKEGFFKSVFLERHVVKSLLKDHQSDNLYGDGAETQPCHRWQGRWRPSRTTLVSHWRKVNGI